MPPWLQRSQPELTRGVQIFQSNCKLGTTKQIIQVEGVQKAIASLALYLEWIKFGTRCPNPQALERERAGIRLAIIRSGICSELKCQMCLQVYSLSILLFSPGLTGLGFLPQELYQMTHSQW